MTHPSINEEVCFRCFEMLDDLGDVFSRDENAPKTERVFLEEVKA